MKNLIFYLFVFSLTFQQVNAQWWSSAERVKGNGEVTSENRDLPDYDKVAVSGSFDVLLLSGKEGNIRIEAEENLMQYIETEVSDGVLKIRTKEGYNLSPTEEMKITVPFEDLDAVALSGSGEIMSSDRISSRDFRIALSGSGEIGILLDTEKLEAAISGSGEIGLEGSADEAQLALSGSGDVKASDFEAKNIKAVISGSGDMAVFASEGLEATVSGSGDITYRGNPARQDFRTSGSGSIAKE